MADFDVKDYWQIYLNKEMKERVKQIQDHLEDNYEGKGDFLQAKLEQEQPLSLEDRIEKARKKREEFEEKEQRLKQIKRERSQQDKLRDKRELLKEKQKKLEEVQESGVKSEADLLRREAFARVNRGYSIENHEIQEYIRNAVDSKLESRPDVNELVEDVQRLQRQVAELNGGEENYFMDLEAVEVEKP